jgi:ketosteroid isomerase-like protein
MSRENVDVVRRVFGQVGAPVASPQALYEALDPDLEWDISAHPLPDFPDTGHGRDAWFQHFETYLAGWLDYSASVQELVDAGDHVIAIVHERARLRASEVVLERDLPVVWSVRGSRLARFRVFKSRDEALEAVGPRE